MRALVRATHPSTRHEPYGDASRWDPAELRLSEGAAAGYGAVTGDAGPRGA